jgi:simple sugar transport system substrate-binding protein
VLTVFITFITAALSLILAAGSASQPASGGANQQSPFKVGMVFDGSIQDGGYDQSAYEGMQRAITRIGRDKVSLSYTEHTPYTSQMTQVVNGMIADGAELIVDMAAGAKLVYDACEPNESVQCIMSNAFPPLPDNVQGFYPMNWYTDYLTGVAAGLVTKTGRIGYVASFKIPTPIFESINSVALGCQSVRPNCRVLVTYLNSWYDPPKETRALNTMVGAGADVLVSYLNTPIPVQVAQKRGVWGVGIFADQRKYGPNAFLTSRIVDWGPTYEGYIRAGMAGRPVVGGGADLWRPGPRLHLSPFGRRVPPAVKTRVNRLFKEFRAGKSPFVGPIYDQSGKLRVRKGVRLPDRVIYSKWTWLVKGVVSSG